MIRHRIAFLVGGALLAALLVTSASAQSIGGGGLSERSPELEAADLLREDQPSDRSTVAGGRPFGHNLFSGGFSNDREDGLNPGYLVQPGDRVSVRIWGATEFNDTITVDPQGNIFLPAVGPIAVAGVRNADLNARVSGAVGRVFTNNVRVYTSLDGTQPVAVFVTGFVNNPGRFAGIPSNSALHFLDRAGGIHATRGSYRNIAVLRDGQSIASLDLYDFLFDGQLPAIQFRDGDTIVVGPRQGVVTVSGDVANAATFELDSASAPGSEIARMALLAPAVGYAGVSGVRDNQPFSRYMPLAEFETMALLNGDDVHFRTDQHDQVIVVDVEGARSGPSRFAVPRNTRLQELLDYIEVDTELADAGAVYLKRKTIAARQKAALEESLQRLEARYLTASSQTDKESAIRTNEAALIGQFVQRARQVEPNGRLVVARDGEIANILLQAGDTITIPPRSDSVLLSGEVLVSQAMLFEPGLNALDYIERSGGFSQQAERQKIVLVHANGEVSSGENPKVRAGDEIIVLPKVPVKNLQIASTIVDILYKVAIAASVAVQL